MKASDAKAQTQRWARLLDNDWPLVGPWLRRRAVSSMVESCDRPQVVPALVACLSHSDPWVANRARSCLSELQGPAAVDALCEEAIRKPQGPAARICLEFDKRPTDHERRCLFLLLMGDLDAYFREDYAFQALRLEYDRAEPPLRKRILRVLRSGDRRLLAFFQERKPLADCSDAEIRFALRSFYDHQDWPKLFRAFLELPLRFGLRILHDLGRANWEPDDAADRSLYRQALADSRGLLPPTGAAAAESRLIDRWLAEGRVAPLSDRGSDDLAAELLEASPADGVRIVGALTARVSPGSELARAVRNHRHWLVRLAGHRSGLAVDLSRDTIDDPVVWVHECSAQYPLLELSPRQATPALLEALADASQDEKSARLAEARKVLGTLMAHRVTTGSFDEMIVEVEAFDGEFELVDDESWKGTDQPNGEDREDIGMERPSEPGDSK